MADNLAEPIFTVDFLGQQSGSGGANDDLMPAMIPFDGGEKVFKGPDFLEPQSNFDPNRNYLMPLSRVELDVNPNLNPQNPGY